MRKLYQQITEFYELQEALSKMPSSDIISDEGYHQTKLTHYQGDAEFTPSRYHQDYSGVTHSVAWMNKKKGNSSSITDKKNTLHDAAHLHNHYIQNNTDIGDVVRSDTMPDADGEGNKRARIYGKMAGFGGLNKAGEQYGIVKKHADDHPEEHKRGKKYLHPLEHDEINAHGDKPSAGSTDGKIRTMSRDYGEGGKLHITRRNRVMHGTAINADGSESEHMTDTESDHPDNEKHLAELHSHHKDYVNSKQKSKTPAIDALITKLKTKK